MSQNSVVLPTTGTVSGLQQSINMNNALDTLATHFSGASSPSSPEAYQFWADTSTNLLKLRNGANTAWITVGDMTATNLGLLPPASQTDMEAYSSNAVAVTPGHMIFHPGCVKAWARYDIIGGTPTLAGSLNIASLTDNGVGVTTLTYSSQLSSTGNCVLPSMASAGFVFPTGNTTTSCQITTQNTSGTNTDISPVYVAVLGDMP